MNIFDEVTVTLTEHGKRIMDDYIKKLEKETGMEFKSPYVNNSNVIMIPLCSLMHIFGKDIHNVFIHGETPFKDNEIICGEKMNEQTKDIKKDKQETSDIAHGHGIGYGK